MAIRENPPLWLQNFRTASFRGVEFKIDSVDSQFGRRTVTHEYPQRDKPFTEDMGRAARQFTLSAYLVGPSYTLQRDALIKACETAGAGELIHPYQGSLQVVVKGVTVRESRANGGYCELSLTFVEDGENTYPAAVSNLDSAVNKSATDAQTVIGNIFQSKYDLSNLPEFVRTEMTAAANTLLGPTERLLSSSNDFADTLSAFKAGLSNLIYQPAALFAGFLNVINSVTKLVGKNKQTSATLHDMAVTALRLVPRTTGTRTRQANAQDSLGAMVNQLSVSEYARVLSGRSYDSYQEALTSRSEFLTDLDSVAETAADEVFDTLQTLRAQVVQALPDPKLPEIQTVVMRSATPALVLAYQLYGDALQDADIIGRNNIKHPGFIPGGSSVEVVIRG